MSDQQSKPWWKFGHVWLIIAGPAVVVVASFVTLALALNSPNPMVGEGPHAVAPADEGESALTPAVQARNHAITGSVVEAPAKRHCVWRRAS